MFVNLNLKRPCKNCPFLSPASTIGRAIDLRPGRVKQIATDMLDNDREPFLCHKTLNGSYSGDGVERDEDGNGNDEQDLDDACVEHTYRPGNRDSVCVGSMVFLLKARSPNVAMRMGAALGLLDYDRLRPYFDQVLSPEDVFGSLA